MPPDSYHKDQNPDHDSRGSAVSGRGPPVSNRLTATLPHPTPTFCKPAFTDCFQFLDRKLLSSEPDLQFFLFSLASPLLTFT